MTARKTTTPIEKADRKASAKVNGKRDTLPMRVIGAASDIGDQPQMRAICVATIAVGLIRRDALLAKTGAKMLAAHTVATWGKSAVKKVVDRQRPDSGSDPKVTAGRSDGHDDTSFPSGHSAGVAAVAEAVARCYPNHAFAARMAALTVATAQIPRGTHYVGDVLAGALIGLVGEKVANSAVQAGTRLMPNETVAALIEGAAAANLEAIAPET